ncbi:DUF1704 domain-containing protein [Patescibacteria group bacterium]|nr:DUF1704 domain-containing protein [Patescibacteria group bacterium]
MRKISFFEKASGILGMNARNLLYVGRFNPCASKKFADDKIFTKNYLSSRGIGVAKIYNVIKTHQELRNFDPKSLPNSFVIKPNRGYGGEGIVVIKEKSENKFVTVNNKEYLWRDLYRQMIAILDGKYAISGLSDQIIIEEMLVMHDDFTRFTSAGLPDIRIIVFNYVPVIAMLRLPTDESNGKANLHMGAVGIGIDIATGRATYAVQHNKFIRRLPNGEKINDIQVPNWNEVMLTAARAQHVSQIGFLAVDIVITSTGIKVLELNARAGLSVQIANQVPLKARLKKVADLKVPNPEKGVEISKTLFSANLPEEKEEKQEDRPIIGLFEYVDVLNNTKYKNLLAKIDPHAKDSYWSNRITDFKNNNGFVNIKIKDRRITLPLKFKDLGEEKADLIIAGKHLTDFIIDINLRQPPKLKQALKKKGESVGEKMIKSIDKKIFEIESKINTIGALRPINLDQEKESFLNNPVSSPHFFYRRPSSSIEQFRRELKSLPTNIDHPLAKIYTKKIDEVKVKLDLLEAVDSSHLQSVSERLYGKADKMLYDQAVRYIHENPISFDDSSVINNKSVVKKLEEFLKQKHLNNWKVVLRKDTTADIAVNKNGTIFLREGVEFSKNRFRAIIAHEIETHVYRFENGSLQKYKIFEKGTANYLVTEEGLAVYNQKQLGIPLGEKDIWPALRSISAYLADEMSFVDLFHYMKKNYSLDSESAWQTCLKVKRGLADTSKKIAFTRDTIYFRGYLAVSEYLKQKGAESLRDLYIGKISINDLQFLGDLGEYKVKFMPSDYINV